MMACRFQNHFLDRAKSFHASMGTDRERAAAFSRDFSVNCSIGGEREKPLPPPPTLKENRQYLGAQKLIADHQIQKLPSVTGKFGEKFVPETIIASLNELESVFNSILKDSEFQRELETTLRDYVGRETPLYFAERLTDYYENSTSGTGPEIYLKREDLNHYGTHKMNNAIAQAMLAQRLGLTSVVASTGAGQHGLATAAASAKLSLDCTVFMGSRDVERQPSNVVLMKQLGAQVKCVDGSFKDAESEAIHHWVNNLETTYHLVGTAAGPHPCLEMVREFQSVIGKETRKQAMEKWGGKPDVLVACVGSGSNALGLFHEFVADEDVRLIVVEGAGNGLDPGKHSATLVRGEDGAMSYLLQDVEGQIMEPHFIGVGLEYPAVSPELSFLKVIGRAEHYCVSDEEAVFGRLEGIFPALEAVPDIT